MCMILTLGDTLETGTMVLSKTLNCSTIHMFNTKPMTQQQLLQNAREVLVNSGTDSQRKLLQSYAVQQGRTIAQIKKASTFRLAMWSRGLKSAI